MGYVNHNTRRPWLVIDTETTAIQEIDQYADDLRIDSRLKDPAKIAEARQAALEKVAVDIDLARIVCMGLWASDDDAPVIWTGDTEAQERDMLEAFWRAYRDVIVDRGGALVCYNGLSFDLPLVTRRSQLLCVQTEPINLYKYRSAPVIDLQNELSFQGAKPFRSLGFYCRRFGIDIPDETSGADMPGLIAAGDWDGVRAHNLADLQRTQALAARLRLISPASAAAGREVA
jgi:hypothetical protein